MAEKKFSIGSNRENAKQIDINITKTHLYFGLIVLTLISVLSIIGFIDFGQTTEVFVECVDGTKEIFTINNTFYCGENLAPETYAQLKEVLQNE